MVQVEQQAVNLFTTHGVDVALINDGEQSPLASGVSLTLWLVSVALDPFDDGAAAASEAPPQYGSETEQQQRDNWLIMSISEHPPPSPEQAQAGDITNAHTLLEVPIPATLRVVSLPDGRSYVVPLLAGVLAPPTGNGSMDNDDGGAGFVKVTLPASLSASEHEAFENILWGMSTFHSSTGDANTAAAGSSTRPVPAPPAGQEGAAAAIAATAKAPPPHIRDVDDKSLRGNLVLVDENDGNVVGVLAEGTDVHESASLHSDQDDKEPVVVDFADQAKPDFSTAGGKSSTVTITPMSAWQPTPNPTGSRMITLADYVSRGVVVGAEALAGGLDSGAKMFVARTKGASDRAAANGSQPIVFSERTRQNVQTAHHYSTQAAKFSASTAKAIGEAAGSLGDNVGRRLGIQTGRGANGKNKEPTGLRGVMNRSLISFNTILDSVEQGGKLLLDAGTNASSAAFGHRYGDDAATLTKQVGGSAKNVALVYVDARGVSRRALLKSVGRNMIVAPKQPQGSATASGQTSSALAGAHQKKE